jgi:hypothetical protein
MNLNIIDNDFEYRFNPNAIDISIQQISLFSLLRKLENAEIDFFADYQRHWNLWNKTKQSRLIESILIRIPIPSFYFDSGTDGKWQVVDGLQRVSTFLNFIIKENFKLDGLEFLPQFNGSYFSDLPRELQRRIEECTLTINLINRGTPEEIKFIIFSRINTGGVNLNSQELRYAMNQGVATKLLVELSQLPEFKEATSNSISKHRMTDLEYVNRFIAFLLFPDEYSGNLDTFLNNALNELNRESFNINLIREDFRKAMIYFVKIFGSIRFGGYNTRIEGRAPKSLFEALSVNLARLSINELDQLVKKRKKIIAGLNELYEDKEFVGSIRSSSNSKIKVYYRFERIRNIYNFQL